MRVRFTDSDRFPGGRYVPASKTDISKTFARVKRQLDAQAKAASAAPINVTAMIRAVK